MFKVYYVCLIIFSLIFVSACTGSKQTAGLTVDASPKAKVSVDGKELGNTKLTVKNLNPGQHTVLIKSDTSEWSDTISIPAGTIMNVMRVLPNDTSSGGGYKVTMEKGSGITVVTNPDEVDVALDGAKIAKTPHHIPSVQEGEHELVLSKDGYSTVSLKIKSIAGHKIVVESEMVGTKSIEPSSTPSATPVASSSASVSASLRPSTVPTASASATPATGGAQTVEIIDTPTGWLRVRDTASLGGKEIGRVDTGEKYDFVEQTAAGWTQIVMKDGTKGYVSTKYVKKVSGPPQATQKPTE